jgi:hypothetical protein
MPITVFDIKGIPGHRRERIETAVVASGKHVSAPHEACIVADPCLAFSGSSSRDGTRARLREPPALAAHAPPATNISNLRAGSGSNCASGRDGPRRGGLSPRDLGAPISATTKLATAASRT